MTLPLRSGAGEQNKFGTLPVIFQLSDLPKAKEKISLMTLV
jgi:hypothetical protein